MNCPGVVQIIRRHDTLNEVWAVCKECDFRRPYPYLYGETEHEVAMIAIRMHYKESRDANL